MFSLKHENTLIDEQLYRLLINSTDIGNYIRDSDEFLEGSSSMELEETNVNLQLIVCLMRRQNMEI